MHQQIRLSLGARSSKDGPGAMNAMPVEVDPIEVRGSLLQLLDLLDSEGFDIRLVATVDAQACIATEIPLRLGLIDASIGYSREDQVM